MKKNFLKFDYEKFNDNKIKNILSRFGDYKKLKILFVSTYKSNYTRTEYLINLFDRNKINYSKLLYGENKFKYLKLLYQISKKVKDYDVIFVNFRGQEILPFIRLFSNKPIIFDAFVSVYDTMCFDRKKFKPNSFIGRFFKLYDTYLCKISDVVLVDTKTHKNYFEKEFNTDNLDFIYVGANKNLFKPIKKPKNKEKIIFWYGYANPLQGADIILKSAKILEKDKKIKFKLAGPIKEKYPNLIDSLKLRNVEFIDFIPYEKLPDEINKSFICLGGHFSNIPKARRVIAGKTFQFLACNKPTIVGDNEANREIFNDKGLVHFVKINNENLLANKILEVLR